MCFLSIRHQPTFISLQVNETSDNALQLAVFQCKNLYKGRQKRKREREGCIYLTDLPIPHVAQYTLSQLYIGHIRRCLQRESSSFNGPASSVFHQSNSRTQRDTKLLLLQALANKPLVHTFTFKAFTKVKMRLETLDLIGLQHFSIKET